MDAKRHSRQQRRWIGYVVGLIISLTFVGVVSLTQHQQLQALGPMNAGHEDLNCLSCHSYAPGSIRQQLQANTRYILGWRKSSVDFGRQSVGNARCSSCHERPNDRHPVFRFVEPRFKKVRQELQPQQCTSCHEEHSGKRMTQRATFCRHCHQETRLKRDPIDISHDRLIAAQRWSTCLQCHDFHGNHNMKTVTVLDQAIPPQQLLAYFDGGPSPYPGIKQYKAKIEEPPDAK